MPALCVGSRCPKQTHGFSETKWNRNPVFRLGKPDLGGERLSSNNLWVACELTKQSHIYEVFDAAPNISIVNGCNSGVATWLRGCAGDSSDRLQRELGENHPHFKWARASC